MDSPRFTPIVGGLLLVENRLLIARRPMEKAHGGLWEFPGGKMEHGERPEQALIREFREEFDLPILVGPPERVESHSYDGLRTILLIFYWIRVAEEGLAVHALEHSEIAWVSPGELADYLFPEADARLAAEMSLLPDWPLRAYQW